jgi:amidase
MGGLVMSGSRHQVRGALATLLLLGTLLVGGNQVLAGDEPPATIGSIDLEATTIPELQQLMDAGELTSEQLVQYYLDRIEQLNPMLNAVITVSPKALDDARAADQARAGRTEDPPPPFQPLLGIPVLVKDNIHTTGMPTTAGSLALAGSEPPDAFLVTRLREAGAIILGKAILSEWANFRSSPSSSGWSAVGGQVNNPYALDRNPCGSSSGSAVAVAANLVTVAVGTETDGSIVCPAGANGIVGIKPSLGLVSRSGIVPISSLQDTAGPMARNVTDAAVLLGALAGVDPDDPGTAGSAGHAVDDYTYFLDPGALAGARIGVWREGNFGIDPRVDAVMEETVTALREAGATIVDPANVRVGPIYEPELTALLHEFKDEIGAYLETLEGDDLPKTLQDLIDFNLEHADEELQYFQQELFDMAQATGGKSDPSYLEARTGAANLARAWIDNVLAAHDLDAVMAPTGDVPWLTDLVNGDSFAIGSSTPSAVAGYPSITIPAGYSFGLPLGVTLIGPNWGEPRLLALAYALEQATNVRVPPSFPASVDVPEPSQPPSPTAPSGASPSPAS